MTNIASRMRALLRRFISIDAPTPRQLAAFDFLFRWLEVSAEIGRLTYCDFRIRALHQRYLRTVSAECWRQAA